MPENHWNYGPVTRGIYHALIAAIVPLSFAWPDHMAYYLLFVFFLGTGLRPLLDKTGAILLFEKTALSIDEKVHRSQLKKHRQKIDRQVRDTRYRKSRDRDKRLPKNW